MPQNGRYVLAVAVSFNDGRKFVPMVGVHLACMAAVCWGFIVAA